MLFAAVGVSLVGASPASADVLLGEDAFIAARDDASAVAPDAPCDATAADPAELRTLAAASGSATVICLGPNWAYRSPAVYDPVDEIRIDRDVVIDLQGNTRDNIDTTSLRIAVAPGHHLQVRDTSPTPGMLTLLRGIQVPPTASLVVWSGGIMPWGQYGDAAIGGVSGQAGGDIVVRGGTVDAHSEWDGAGIGGGSGADGGSFTMWGGTVTTTSGSGAALGGGVEGDGGAVTVHGGALTATAGGFTTGACPWMCIPVSAPAIGGGNNGSGGDVLVTGGTVVATSLAGGFGVGIGGSMSNSGPPVLPGTLTVTGGSVTASGTEGIGGGANSPGGTVTISGGEVHVAAGLPIGGQFLTSAPHVTVTGGTLDATPIVLEGEDDWVMRAVIGAGGATAASGSLTIGPAGAVSLAAKGGSIFGAHGLASVEVAGTLSIADGYAVASGAADLGIPEFEVATGGRIMGSGELRGVAGGVVVNDGTITAPVALPDLTVQQNNYLVSFADPDSGPIPSLRVFAPTLVDAGAAPPSIPGVAAWVTPSDTVVDATSALAGVVTSGSRALGTAAVDLSSAAGSLWMGLPAVVAVGDHVTPTIERRSTADAAFAGADDSATFTVSGSTGDVTPEVVAGDVLTFSTPGVYTVTATSAAAGFSHLTAVASIEVATMPTITTTTLPDAVSGEWYSAELVVTGSPVPSITDDGMLPPGLTRSGLTISGTPTAAGDHTFTITATNEAGPVDQTFTLHVDHGAPVSLALSLPTGAVARQGGSVTLAVEGTDALGQQFDAGGLVTLSSDVSTDAITGTTVTFPHASPHVIAASLTSNPLVFTTLLIEVEPLPSTAAAPLAATGATDPSSALAGAVLALLAGAALLVLRATRRRLSGGRR